MPDAMSKEFYGEAYFEGKSRQSPPHTRHLIYPMAARTAAYLCHLTRPRSALDVGCAKGYMAEALTAEGIPFVSGVDISWYALRQGGSGMRGKMVLADVQAGLPIASDSFDLITALDLFEHLADPVPVLREMHRILSANGMAYLKICHPQHPNAQRDPSHINVQPLAYWTASFTACGFTWRRIFETDLTRPSGALDSVKRPIRRFREWAVIGTPADFKFTIRKASHA